MSKTKMRCIVCGKWFQSANAKEVTCPDCMQKARKEKMATKNASPTANKSATGPTGQSIGGMARSSTPPKPKPVQGGTSHWLDTLNDVKIGQPDQPQRPRIPVPPPSRDNRGLQGGQDEFRSPGNYREDHGPGDHRQSGNRGPGGYRDREYEQRSPAGYRVGGGAGLTETSGTRPRQSTEGSFGRGPRQDKPHPSGQREGTYSGAKPKSKAKAGTPKSVSPPKPKREKTPPPPPFSPTPEQIALVETRYIELAVPTEFDGIRTQIAKELSLPKKAVKKIIKDLRDRQSIPSWWELQTYKGSTEELEKIKAVYEPLLPVPPIGVHKKIAEELGLKAGVVYQAIKAIRQEMNLPQYNNPLLHKEELTQQPTGRQTQAQEQAAIPAEPVPVTSETTDNGVSVEAKIDGTET